TLHDIVLSARRPSDFPWLLVIPGTAGYPWTLSYACLPLPGPFYGNPEAAADLPGLRLAAAGSLLLLPFPDARPSGGIFAK
ncbi:MAG: hypothetical protein LBI14_11145, partial [Treponema sp.]|nr:hypothetical protein [Treponema sp.]